MLQIDVARQLTDVKIITPHVRLDGRGFFFESFRDMWFEERGMRGHFCQDNHSLSTKGTLRGLHYQVIPYAQAKLVRCIQGQIFDVAVDIRPSSPTFGKWHGEILNSENKKMMYIPDDFAHGFYVMSDTAEVIYKCSDYYNPEYERTLRYDDPSFNIVWPLLPGVDLELSVRDQGAGFFK